MKAKLNIIDILIIITIGSTFLYVVANNLPTVIGSFRFFWGPILITLLMLSATSIISSYPMRWLIAYGVFSVVVLQLVLWDNMSSWNITQIRNEFYALIAALSVWSYYRAIGRFDKMAVLGKYAIFFIFVTVIVTHIALFVDPFIVRDSANSYGENLLRLNLANSFGIAGYGYAQSLIVLLPIIILFLKSKKILLFNTAFNYILFILIIALILRANVFANILVMLPILYFSFAKVNTKRLMLFSIIFTFIILALPADLMSVFIFDISNYFEVGSFLNQRLVDLGTIMNNPDIYDGTETGDRIARYPHLFEAFIAQPLLGDASYQSKYSTIAGGHLFLMNRLTIWGLPAFGFFVYIIYAIFKAASKYFDPTFRYYYIISIIALIGFGLTKNVSGREIWFMLIVIIPSLYMIYKQAEPKVYQNN
jgi:hypothetical protein